MFGTVMKELRSAIEEMKRYIDDMPSRKGEDINQLGIEYMVKCDKLYYDKYGNAWFREFSKEEYDAFQDLIDECSDMKFKVYEAIQALN